jgi:hypothetical protein
LVAARALKHREAAPTCAACAKEFRQEHNTMKILTKARQQIPMQHLVRRQRSLVTLALGFALSVLPAILGGKKLSAHAQSPQAAKPAQQQKPQANAVQPAASEIAAAQPPSIRTDPPANGARVIWDNRGLEIEASNSSLNQILHQVAADTGAKLEGLTQDQRVFGRYGPGPASEVLWKLLEGSGYNVFMTGCLSTGTPLEIVLSVRSPASPQTAANNQNRSEQSRPEPPPTYPPELPRPEPVQNPFGNGEPPRDPLQFMQEILQRQQKIDQQQQQEQQNNPHQ